MTLNPGVSQAETGGKAFESFANRSFPLAQRVFTLFYDLSVRAGRMLVTLRPSHLIEQMRSLGGKQIPNLSLPGQPYHPKATPQKRGLDGVCEAQPFPVQQGQWDLPSALTGQARSESEDETSAPGSYKGEKKREGRREPGQVLQAEPALTSCPGKPRPGLSAALRRTGSASTPAQTWEAEEPESSRNKAKEEGSPVQVAQGTGAGSGEGKPEAGKNSSSGSGRPQREALQPSGGRCCSEGSSPEDAYPGLEHERFHIQGVPTRPPRENTGSRLRRMRGTCPVPCHLRRLLPVSSLGVSVRGC